MLSQNAIERTCGVLLVVLAVAVVATAAIGEGFSTYEKSFDEALHEVAEDSGLFKAGLVTSFLAGLVGLVLASTMYFAYREHDRPVSLLGGLWLLAFGAAMAGSSVAGSAVLHMADQFDTAAAANSQAIAIGARPAHVLRESSGIVALTVFLPLATLTFGVVIVRSRAVPAWLGWLAVVAGAAMSLFWVPEVGWFIFILGTPLALLWLVVLGGWMLVRGTRRPTRHPRSGPSRRSHPPLRAHRSEGGPVGCYNPPRRSGAMTTVQKRLVTYIGLVLAALLLLIINQGLLFLLLVAGLVYVLFRTRAFARISSSVHIKFMSVIAAMAFLFLYVTLINFGAMNNMHDQVHVLKEMETFQPSVVRSALNALEAVPHRTSLGPYFSFSILLGALGLAAAMAWSVTEPVGKVREGMRRIASGDFSQPVEVANRDELGELAAHINTTAMELKRLQEMTLAEERERALRDRVTQVTLAQEEERRRISRELHDGLGPSLAAMGNRLRASKKILRSDPDRAEKELEEIAGAVKGYIQEIRELIYELRPLALDQLGLAGALDQYVERFAHETGIEAGFSASGDIEINPLADVTVLRVVQECLANVQTHAGADRVEVSLAAGANELEIRVEDDGRGFDTEMTGPDAIGRGVGLLSMRERAELLGGSLAIDSGPGKGCRVVLSVPMGEVNVGPHNGPAS